MEKEQSMGLSLRLKMKEQSKSYQPRIMRMTQIIRAKKSPTRSKKQPEPLQQRDITFILAKR